MQRAGPGLDVATTLEGRSEELHLIRAFLDTAATGGGSLVLLGEPGTGKTALVDAAEQEAAAAGTEVLRAAGVEFEVDVSFSALNQLLLPLRDHLSSIDEAHRAALVVALGLTDESTAAGRRAPAENIVANAVLALLRQAALVRPVLAVVDDVPWLDRSSAAILAFVARRLRATRVGLIATARSGAATLFRHAGLVVHELGPLNDAAASRLLTTHFPALSKRARARVLTEAQGNPLALLELPKTESHPYSGATQPQVTHVSLSRRLQMLFGARIAELPAAARHVLLLAALDGTGEVKVLVATAGERALGDLAMAEDAELVFTYGGTRMAFRHPLTRAAVVALATLEERRAAHRALAAAFPFDVERRAAHLAQAAITPDESVAALLTQASGRLLQLDRHRRPAEAAYLGADVTGDLPGAANMLQEATDGQSEVAGPLAGVVAAAYMLLNAHCDVDAAHRLLTSALLARGDRLDADDEAMDTALHSLLMVCWSSGRLELWADFDTLLTRLTPAPPHLLGVCAATFGDPARRARTALRPLSQALLALRDEHDPVQITRVGVASVYVDRIEDCREPLQRVVDDGREGGAIAAAINALTTLSVDGWFKGRWDEVLELTTEGEKLCEAHGYKRYSWILGGYVATLVAAARGNRARSLAAADELSDWAHITGAGIAQVFAQHLRTLVALGDGAFSSAYDSVTAISSPGQLPIHVPHALWVPLDLVESAQRSDHLAEARAHAQELDASGIAALSPRLSLLTAACAAVVAPDAAFADLFQQALGIPEVERWPFDLARVQLLFGERLRRARSLTLAREQLAASRDAFQRLGAVPWTRRAETELRAAGYAGTTPVHVRGIALTAQEREIAELAAAGRTNKEIAEQLFLSPRTVGAHLYKVFPKLGITSRAALRDALTPPSG